LKGSFELGANMRKIIGATVLATALIISSGVGAQNTHPRTVKDFISACQVGSPWMQFCIGNVSGITQLQLLIGAAGGFKGNETCYPVGVSIKQRVDVFVAWAKENEAQWSEPAVYGIVESAVQAWPCPNGGVSSTQDIQKGLSVSVSEAVAAQVARCWNLPAGINDAGDLSASLRIKMKPDATVKSAMIVSSGGRLKSDQSYKAIAESALKAVLNRHCQPLPLPLDQYDQWKTMTLNFSPQGISIPVGGEPTSSGGQQVKAQKAIQCSALYLIASSLTAGNKQAAEQMMLSQFLFERVFVSIESKRLNQTFTNGIISERKSVVATQLGQKYDQNPGEVYALEMQCNAWRKQIGIHLDANMEAAQGDAKAAQAVFRKSPNIQQSPPDTDPRWSRSKSFVDDSFAAWTKLGRMTPMSAKQQIREALPK
jgi:hypothetical protein